MKGILAAAVTALLWASAAQAAVISWSATLAPGNEVPPVVGSSASGSATGTVDTITGDLTWDIMFGGFATAVTGMHFHAAPPDANGPVIVNIGAISGLGSPNVGATQISDAQVSDLLAGLWYINVHSEAVPSGEIRGQVGPAVVPLPAGAILSLSALSLLFAARRVRRRTG